MKTNPIALFRGACSTLLAKVSTGYRSPIDLPKKRSTHRQQDFKGEKQAPPKWLKPCKWGAYLTILGASLTSAWKTVTGNWEISNLAALARVTTNASGSTIPPSPTLFPGYTLDAFIGNHVNPQEIKDSMIKANIDPKVADLNGDHIIANTQKEAEHLAKELMASANSNVPKKILEASKYSELIFPPKTLGINQGDELNCFLMDEIEGLPEQFKKGMIRVTGFDKDTKDMKMTARINGKEYEVNRLGEDGINKWVSSSFNSSNSGNYLLVPVITLAAEKAFNEHKLLGFISLPQKYQMWRLPPGYATLLTGKQHSVILVKNLSCAQLRKILSNADKTVITLAKFPSKKDIAGTKAEPGLFQRLEQYYNRDHSARKENNFEREFQTLVQRVESEKKGETKVEYKPKVKPFIPISQLSTNHVYQITNGKSEKTNLIEDNSSRLCIPDKEILRNFDVIVVDNEYLDHFPIGPLTGGLIGLVVVNIGARALKKRNHNKLSLLG